MTTYSPQNSQVFQAAFSGALAGIAVNNAPIVDPVPADYLPADSIAGAYAQAVDTEWGGASADCLEVAVCETASQAYFANRSTSPQSLKAYSAVGISNEWLTAASSVVAIMLSADAYFTAQGIAVVCEGGASGPTGPTGATGTAGTAGATGATGATGSGGGGTLEGDAVGPLLSNQVVQITGNTGGVVPVVSPFALGTNPADSGIVRLPNSTAIVGRNAANSGDLPIISTDSGNDVILGNSAGSSVDVTTTSVVSTLGGNPIFGVDGFGLFASTGAAISVATSHVLSSGEYQNPVLTLTGEITTETTLTFPNTPGAWLLDLTGVMYLGGESQLNGASGSGTTIIATGPTSPTLIVVRTSGSNTIASSFTPQ